MKNIGIFFDKFKNKAVKEIYKRDSIAKIIKNIAKIDIDIKNMEISLGILKIKTSPIEKSEIFIKKDRILKEINKKIDGSGISDIQ